MKTITHFAISSMLLVLFWGLQSCQPTTPKEKQIPQENPSSEKVSQEELSKIEIPEEELLDFEEVQAFRRLSKEFNLSALDSSGPGSNSACQALRSRMSSMREEHGNMHDMLLEMQRHERLCMMNKGDKSIGEGACDHWNKEANAVRESQKRIYEEFQRMQEEMARVCK